MRHEPLAHVGTPYLDFASCELHAFNQRATFKLRRPYLSVWNPQGLLETLEVDEEPPRHETFEPYPHGDPGLIWELVDCIKWLRRGRTTLAKTYLVNLARDLEAKEPGLTAAHMRKPPSQACSGRHFRYSETGYSSCRTKV